MRRAFSRRQRGQTITFAAIAVVALLGAVAMVVDAGIFFVVQRQLQTAADAAALAGAWHDPICTYVPPSAIDPTFTNGCLQASAFPAPVDMGPPEGLRSQCPDVPVPTYVACNIAQANADTVKQLCGGYVAPALIHLGTKLKLNRPKDVNVIVVTVKCSAGFSFGRILNLDRKPISASAAAGIGDRDGTTGDMTNFTPSLDCRTKPPDQCRIARLIE